MDFNEFHTVNLIDRLQNDGVGDRTLFYLLECLGEDKVTLMDQKIQSIENNPIVLDQYLFQQLVGLWDEEYFRHFKYLEHSWENYPDKNAQYRDIQLSCIQNCINQERNRFPQICKPLLDLIISELKSTLLHRHLIENKGLLQTVLKEKKIAYCHCTRLTENVSSNNIKFIIVGDNPGIEEIENSQYFIGKSGFELKNIFENLGLVKDFYSETLVTNKVPIHTTETNLLLEIKKELGDFFEYIIDQSVEAICAFQKVHSAPIFLFGKSQFKTDGIFSGFIEKLSQHTNDFYIFSHPSRNHFWNEFLRYKKQSPNDLSNLELLIEIGTKNKTSYNKT